MLQPHRITVKLGRSVGITHGVPLHDPDRPTEYVHLRFVSPVAGSATMGGNTVSELILPVEHSLTDFLLAREHLLTKAAVYGTHSSRSTLTPQSRLQKYWNWLHRSHTYLLPRSPCAW